MSIIQLASAPTRKSLVRQARDPQPHWELEERIAAATAAVDRAGARLREAAAVAARPGALRGDLRELQVATMHLVDAQVRLATYRERLVDLG